MTQDGKKLIGIIKKKKKIEIVILDGVPKGLPEIHKARRIEKASSVGFDWNNINHRC